MGPSSGLIPRQPLRESVFPAPLSPAIFPAEETVALIRDR